MPSVVVQSSTRTPLPSATSPFRGIGLDESAAEEHTDADSVDRLGQVLVENERLRARVAELEAIVDSARRLQAQLASILTPDHQKN
ncbi:MAG: hypothetical protein KC609_16860 [Myxococcales bacterium]|nr:hypothetical protein [Myxococcales bacterium]